MEKLNFRLFVKCESEFGLLKMEQKDEGGASLIPIRPRARAWLSLSVSETLPTAFNYVDTIRENDDTTAREAQCWRWPQSEIAAQVEMLLKKDFYCRDKIWGQLTCALFAPRRPQDLNCGATNVTSWGSNDVTSELELRENFSWMRMRENCVSPENHQTLKIDSSSKNELRICVDAILMNRVMLANQVQELHGVTSRVL